MMQRSLSKKIKDGLAYILLAVTALYLLIWAFSPTIIRFFAEPILAQHKLVLGSDSTIRYNPFLSALKINHLRLEKGGKTLFYFDSLDVEIRLYRLLAKQLYVSRFELDGVAFDIIEKTNAGDSATEPTAQFWVAGFPVAGDNTKDVSKGQENSSEKIPFAYEIVANKLSVTNSNIDAYLAGGQQTLQIGTIQIANLSADNSRSTAKTTMEFIVNNAPGSLAIHADLDSGVGLIKIDGSLKDYSLDTIDSFLPTTDFNVTGSLDLDFESTVVIDGDRIEIQSKRIFLAGKNVEFSNDVIQLGSDAQELNVTHLNVKIAKEEKTVLELGLKIAIDETTLLSSKKQDTITAWKKLEIDDATVNFQEDMQTHIGTVKVSSAVLSQKMSQAAEEQVPALASLDHIVISSITANLHSTDIDNIVLSGLTTDILIGTDKKLLTLVDIPGRSKKSETDKEIIEQELGNTTPDNDAANNPTEKTYGISLGQLELVDTQRLFFRDSSVVPKYERTFFINKLETGPFNSKKPLEKSPFSIDGRSDKYAKFDFQGHFSPFTDLLNFSLKGQFTEVSLPSVSSYMKDALGFELKSGQLDTELDISVKESVISGKTRLKVRGIEMSAADGNQADSLQDNKALPLNAALSMLKDRNNNIDLKIPLSGNINNPSFGVSSFIALVVEKAALKQAKSYLLQTFVPYASVVSVVMAAGEQALKVRFNDLVYPKTATEISQQQEVFIQQFVKLMEDKPGTQVKVCGIASLSDIRATGKGSSLKESEKEQLRNIAQQRADNFKTYVLSKSDIKSKRLFLCAPEIDFSDNSEPRIEFST